MNLARGFRVLHLARSLRVLLIVALLAAWQNALVHPLEHIDEHGGFVHLADGHGDHGDHGDHGNTGDPHCDAIAAVAVCIGGAQPILPATRVPQASVQDFKSGAAQTAPLLAYRSQAPPQYS